MYINTALNQNNVKQRLWGCPDKLQHTRSVAYSVELVLNKHQITGGGAYLDC